MVKVKILVIQYMSEIEQISVTFWTLNQ